VESSQGAQQAMTDDPIKLFVVVMAILLAVLGFVSYSAYTQAAAYEKAIESATRLDKELKKEAAEVQALCDRIKGTKINQGYRTLISQAAKYNSIKPTGLSSRSEKRGVKGVEKRYKVEIGRSASGGGLTREQIAKFCRTVERDSRGILKTIEIMMTRVSGKGGADKAGRREEVVNERYTVTIIFGLRVLS
jgi:hypothetical protein